MLLNEKVLDLNFKVKHLKALSKGYFLSFLIVFSILISVQSAHATTGCLGDSGTLYTDREVPGNDLNWALNPQVVNAASVYCISTLVSGCRVKRPGGPLTGYYTTAHLVDYQPLTFCPIDDHIWLLFLGAAGFGFFILRKRFIISL